MSQVLQECRLKRSIYLMYLGRETSYASCTIKTPYLTSRYRERVVDMLQYFFERSGILEVVSFLVHEKKVG